MARSIPSAVRDWFRSVDADIDDTPAVRDLDPAGSHTHIYMGGPPGGGAPAAHDEPDVPGAPPAAGGDPADPAGRLDAVEAELGELRSLLEQLLGEDEGEMELEDPETHDARRFTFRRGAKMGARDEDMPVPERKPEMIGETDLPGIEDLDKPSGGGNVTPASDHARFRDSADMEHTWQEALANAEVIVPGYRMPTFDARLEAPRTAERLCALRRRVMDTAFQTAETAATIKTVTGLSSRDQIMGKALSCDTLKVAFNATASHLRGQNNQNSVRRDTPVVITGDKATKPPTLSEMAKAHREFWKNNPQAMRRH